MWPEHRECHPWQWVPPPLPLPRKGSPWPEPRNRPGGQANAAWTRGVSRNPDGARLPVTRADKDPGSWLVSLGRGLPLEPHFSSLEKGRGSSPAAWQSRCEGQRVRGVCCGCN